jgi:ATP:corrinoid adenosyltransferase
VNEDAIGVIIALLIMSGVVVAAITSSIRADPKGFTEILNAFAKFLATPFYVWMNLKHNIKKHANAMQRLDALSSTEQVDAAFEKAVLEVARERAKTIALDEVLGADTLGDLRETTDNLQQTLRPRPRQRSS